MDQKIIWSDARKKGHFKTIPDDEWRKIVEAVKAEHGEE